MAIARMGPIVGAISGSIAGTTFANTKAGTVIRSKLRRTIQRSPQHLTILSLYARLRSAWRALTPSTQQAWTVAALQFPHRNRLGIGTRISGYALFIKANSTGAPFFPEFSPFPLYTTPPNLNVDSPSATVNLVMSLTGGYRFDIDPTIFPLTYKVSIAAARTFRNFPRAAASSYRTIDLIEPITQTALFTIPFNEIIGTPTLGEFIFVQTRLYRTNTPLPFPTILTAFVTP